MSDVWASGQELYLHGPERNNNVKVERLTCTTNTTVTSDSVSTVQQILRSHKTQ